MDYLINTLILFYYTTSFFSYRLDARKRRFWCAWGHLFYTNWFLHPRFSKFFVSCVNCQVRLIVKFISCMIFMLRWNSETQFPYIMVNICFSFLQLSFLKGLFFFSFFSTMGLHFCFWVHMLDHFLFYFLVPRPKPKNNWKLAYHLPYD